MAHKLTAIVGLIILGLSPSFVDFQQSPEMRWQMILYYTVAIALVYIGLDGWLGGE